MRQLKFRAWDSILNRMWSHNELLEPRNYELGGVLECLLSEDNDRFSISVSHVGIEIDSKKDDVSYSISDFHLIQFTGLKDRNGIEIYESDIVKITHKSSNAPDKVYEGFVTISEDNPGMWIVDGYDSGDYYDPEYVQWEKCEVIGNKYENNRIKSSNKKVR